jgi:F420 biosynthesis protein FbiB-like protein
MSTMDACEAAAMLAALRQRRSIRRFRPEPLPRALVESVLTAATWAPSAHNRQPWRFAVVETPAAREHLAWAMGDRLRHDLAADGVDADSIERDVQRSYTRIVAAPLVVVVCLTMADMDNYPDARRQAAERAMAAQSTAMAGQNLLLAAHAAGLGACWMCAPLFCPDVVRGALALPDDWEAQGLIVMGYPAETRTKDRNPLEKSVVWR